MTYVDVAGALGLFASVPSCAAAHGIRQGFHRVRSWIIERRRRRIGQWREQAGFLIHRSDKTYDIGARIISLGQQALNRLDLRRIAHNEIQVLQRRVGHTVHLAQLLEDSVVYVDKVETTDGVRMYSRIGRPVRLTCTGVGKVVLAQLSVPRRDALLRDTDWTGFTKTTHTSRESLDVELNEIEARGWGVDNGEFEDFVNCIAAPITNSTGAIIGALSITSIKMVSPLDQLRTHLDDLLNTVANISRDLG